MLHQQLPVRSPLSLRALRSGVRAALGRESALAARASVEGLLRSRYAAERVLLTDSGTSALVLALKGTASPGPARPVAIPAFGCFDLATAVDAADVPFVLYDVDPATLGPDRSSLRRACEAGADRVLVAHLYGVPVDLRLVREVTATAGSALIDDAAQGAGASIDGIPLGSGGDVGILSFGRGKGVTGGHGGALLLFSAQSRRWPPSCVVEAGPRGSVRELVALIAQWAVGRPSLYGLPASLPFLGLGDTTYRAPHPAAGATALALGVVSESLRHTDEEAEHRRRNADRLRAAMRSDDLAAPRIAPGAVPGFLRCPAVASAARAARARLPEARRLGIMPGYPTALCDLPGFGGRRGNLGERCDGARLLAERLVTLPTHGALEEGDLRALEAWCVPHG